MQSDIFSWWTQFCLNSYHPSKGESPARGPSIFCKKANSAHLGVRELDRYLTALRSARELGKTINFSNLMQCSAGSEVSVMFKSTALLAW